MWLPHMSVSRSSIGCAERITRELKRQGLKVGRRRAARLMRGQGIAGITRRKRRYLTRPDEGAALVPDLIGRRFTAPMPGLKLVGDISCFPTREGWLYLATVLDLCRRDPPLDQAPPRLSRARHSRKPGDL